MTEPRVSKAIIPAAGRGTRFLPATKVTPKELFPLASKPVIHWIAEEAVAAGVEEVVIVISPEKEAIRAYFQPSDDDGEGLAALLARARFSFVYQAQPEGLGDAVLCAREAVGNEAALVLLGDGPILATPPASAQLVDCYRHCGGSVIGLRRVPDEACSSYGIVAGEALGPRLHRLDSLVEKPPPGEAPSNLAIAGRYLLTPQIFPLLAEQAPGVGGEVQLTDAIASLLAREAVHGYVYEGERFDVGHPEGYLAAQLAYARAAN